MFATAADAAAAAPLDKDTWWSDQADKRRIATQLLAQLAGTQPYGLEIVR
ncbi:MAG: hypothetical protein HN396_04425 [Gemmatimonadales bacterium]|nr:hypothetical protein [Gemmatimonadales bacterium]